jgi:hypothetical protein
MPRLPSVGENRRAAVRAGRRQQQARGACARSGRAIGPRGVVWGRSGTAASHAPKRGVLPIVGRMRTGGRCAAGDWFAVLPCTLLRHRHAAGRAGCGALQTRARNNGTQQHATCRPQDRINCVGHAKRTPVALVIVNMVRGIVPALLSLVAVLLMHAAPTEGFFRSLPLPASVPASGPKAHPLPSPARGRHLPLRHCALSLLNPHMRHYPTLPTTSPAFLAHGRPRIPQRASVACFECWGSEGHWNGYRTQDKMFRFCPTNSLRNVACRCPHG